MSPPLLLALEHSLAFGVAISVLFPDLGKPQTSWAASLTPLHHSFIKSMLFHLLRQVRLDCRRISGDQMLSLFEVVCARSQDCVAALALPLARLICPPKVVEGFTDPTAISRLATLASGFCAQRNDTPRFFHLQIQLLTAFARIQECCLAMAKVPEFLTNIIDHLTDPDPIALCLTWHFLRKFTRRSDVLRENFSWTPIIAIWKTEELPAIKKFLEFAIRVCRRRSGRVRTGFFDAMQLSAGQIACLMQNGIHRHDHRFVELIEEFRRVLSESNGFDAAAFMESLRLHLGAETTQEAPKPKGRRKTTPRVLSPFLPTLRTKAARV
jgi:hypothetical protein